MRNVVVVLVLVVVIDLVRREQRIGIAKYWDRLDYDYDDDDDRMWIDYQWRTRTVVPVRSVVCGGTSTRPLAAASELNK